jgi:hypothetical protein
VTSSTRSRRPWEPKTAGCRTGWRPCATSSWSTRGRPRRVPPPLSGFAQPSSIGIGDAAGPGGCGEGALRGVGLGGEGADRPVRQLGAPHLAPGGAGPAESGRGEGADSQAEGQGGRRAEGRPRRQGRCARHGGGPAPARAYRPPGGRGAAPAGADRSCRRPVGARAGARRSRDGAEVAGGAGSRRHKARRGVGSPQYYECGLGAVPQGAGRHRRQPAASDRG